MPWTSLKLQLLVLNRLVADDVLSLSVGKLSNRILDIRCIAFEYSILSHILLSLSLSFVFVCAKDLALGPDDETIWTLIVALFFNVGQS